MKKDDEIIFLDNHDLSDDDDEIEIKDKVLYRSY